MAERPKLATNLKDARDWEEIGLTEQPKCLEIRLPNLSPGSNEMFESLAISTISRRGRHGWGGQRWRIWRWWREEGAILNGVSVLYMKVVRNLKRFLTV